MTQRPRLDLRPGVTEPVVLMISRRVVEAFDVASLVSRLKVFLATRKDAWLSRAQMSLAVSKLKCNTSGMNSGRGLKR